VEYLKLVIGDLINQVVFDPELNLEVRSLCAFVACLRQLSLLMGGMLSLTGRPVALPGLGRGPRGGCHFLLLFLSLVPPGLRALGQVCSFRWQETLNTRLALLQSTASLIVSRVTAPEMLAIMPREVPPLVS
jgi:hypothetical protein